MLSVSGLKQHRHDLTVELLGLCALLSSRALANPMTGDDKVADDRWSNAAYREIERLIHSADGIMLAIRATNIRRPALCGIDVLLRRELGTEYARANGGTRYASHAIAELMVEMGYVKAGSGKCSLDCVAGEGVIWKAGTTPTNHA